MKNKANSLRRKRRIVSTEAALASLLIHGLLLFTAGTVVAVRYVQKNRAEIAVQMEPPRLERRQIQTAPAMEQIRRTAGGPRIVSRAPSETMPAFPLPEMDGLAELETQKIETPFAPGRDFRRLTWAVGVGAPSIRFLDIHDEAERVVFILDVSNDMRSAQTGGPAACRYILRQFEQALADLPSSVLFNVIGYDQETTLRFRDELTPVFEKNRAAAARWLEALLTDSGRDVPAVRDSRSGPTGTVRTAVGGDSCGWLRALHVALEERPETIFLVARNWGHHPVSREKGRALLDFSLWEVLDSGGGGTIGGSPVLEADRALRDDLLKKAVESAEEELERMEANGGSAPFVRDLIAHIQYSAEQLLDHADVVCRSVYEPHLQAPPRIHAVRLVSEEEEGVSDSSTAGFRQLTQKYDGEFVFLNGPDAADRLSADPSAAGIAAQEPADESAERFEETRADFFEMSVKGARMALAIDFSDDLWSGEDGAAAWPLVRRQLLNTLGDLDPQSGFNLLCWYGDTLTVFQPEMTAATNVAAAAAWLDAAFQGQQADPPEFPGNVLAAEAYPSALGADARGMLLAIQAAMEQRADVILAVGGRPGRQPVPREKAQRLLDFSIWSSLGASAGIAEEDEEGDIDVSGGSSGGDLVRPLRTDQKQHRDLIRQALERIEEETERREDSDLPPAFVRDITAYMEYTPEQIEDHLRTVAGQRYFSDGNERETPSLYFVELIGDTRDASGRDPRLLSVLSAGFEGEHKQISVTGDRRELLRLNRRLDL